MMAPELLFPGAFVGNDEGAARRSVVANAGADALTVICPSAAALSVGATRYVAMYSSRRSIAHDQYGGSYIAERALRNRHAHSKLPPLLRASCTAAAYTADMFFGTIDRNPILGGSADGCVRFP